MRLIDADALEISTDPYNVMNGVRFGGRYGGKTAAMVGTALKHMIDNAPTIDAVPVVRCRECWKRGNERECPMCHEEFDGCDYCTIDYTSDDGFCHMGKKVAQDMDVPTKDGGAADG